MISFSSNNILYTIAFPSYPVNLFVDHYVVMKGKGSQMEERVFPNNKGELFFNLGESLKGKRNDSKDNYHLK
ncbi:MAG: hypothetical protein KDD63_03385, partial [Bacteroidetes bacterium]|nr:hypothetical protein [Bacteroidota bacterium]